MLLDLGLGFGAGLVVAVVTTPVGVSGAVFLLPVQLTLLGVANPAVTPTNLLFNVVAGPGALMRYRRTGHLRPPLVRLLLAGTVPGVIAGALIRVFLLPGAQVFRLVAGLVLLALGAWLVCRTVAPARRRSLTDRKVVVLALGIGVLGGIYGIGGGSILSPILIGSGMTVGVVAPAALASTFLASAVGAVTFAVVATITGGSIAPDWSLGIACGVGGLVGGYLGAHIQPHVPERALRLLLGCLAIGVGVLYLGEGLV